MIFIKRKSAVKLPEINGSVVDTFNVEDKVTNAPSIRAVEERMNYSEEEKIIGNWFGKPLYRKTINCGALPNNGMLSVPIEKNMKIIKMEGYATNGAYTMLLPNSHSNSSSVVNVFVDYGTYLIGIETNSDRSSYTETYLTIEYTKTTD